MIPKMDIQKTLVFSISEFKDRLQRVRHGMEKAGLDVLLVTTPENLYYLSGYNTPGYYAYQVLILPLEKDPIFITRLIEQTNVFGFSWIENSIPYIDIQDPIKLTADTLQELGLEKSSIGIEKSGWFFTIKHYEKLTSYLSEAEFVDGSGIVENERAVKSPAEVDYIKQAAMISGVGMQAAVNHLRAGVTEQVVSAQIYKAMYEIGGEYAGLPVFLSSGYRSLLVHAIGSDKVIEPGDNIYLELAGTKKRYSGPLFRTFSIGEPSKKMIELENIVHEMLEQVIEAIKPGATSHEVDAAAKSAASKAGFSKGVTKRAGYSVGINYPPDWGEGHFLELNENDQTILKPGMVFHVPQSIRWEGYPPVALSETVMVTSNGHEVLTDFPRRLITI